MSEPLHHDASESPHFAAYNNTAILSIGGLTNYHIRVCEFSPVFAAGRNLRFIKRDLLADAQKRLCAETLCFMLRDDYL